jgi:hypothetical protein
MFDTATGIIIYVIFTLLGLIHIVCIWKYRYTISMNDYHENQNVTTLLVCIYATPIVNIIAFHVRIVVFAYHVPLELMFTDYYQIGCSTSSRGYPHKSHKGPIALLSYWPSKIERVFAWCISVFITTAYKMARALAFMRRNKEN